MQLDDDTMYAALAAQDPRFDGLFFVGVTSTGIYCRPICPARTAARRNCAFFRSAVEAEREGFRACFRCRPEVAPHAGVISDVDAVEALVGRALDRIDDGALNDGSLEELASELGVSSRHLRRAFERELGVSPIAVAQSRRLALAKQLLHDSRLSLADIAFASGFGSVRRFNAVFSERMGKPPSALRRRAGTADASSPIPAAVRLDARAPFDWPRMVAFFAARAVPGLEAVEGLRYTRAVRIGERAGLVTIGPGNGPTRLRLEASEGLWGALMPLVRRVRLALDLGASPEAVSAHLADDPIVGASVRRRPGLRVAAPPDPFETAVRVILGQQVSVAAARTLTQRLVERFGTVVSGGWRAFPRPEELTDAGADAIASIGMPGRRAETVCAFAEAVARGEVSLDPTGKDPDAFCRGLRELSGIGPWTAELVAMRALRHPDAFPAHDLGIRKALGGVSGRRAAAMAEAWRPWRAYAAMHLWTAWAEGELT